MSAMEWVPAPHPCYYSLYIECETKKKCNRCGWNPIVDQKRRRQEQVWRSTWWRDEEFKEKPLPTKQLVFKVDAND